MNDIIEFEDGTQINGRAGYLASGDLILYMSKYDFLDHVDAIINGDIGEVTYYYGAYKDMYNGFDQFRSVEKRERDDMFAIRFRGSSTERMSKIPTVPEEYLPKQG